MVLTCLRSTVSVRSGGFYPLDLQCPLLTNRTGMSRLTRERRWPCRIERLCWFYLHCYAAFVIRRRTMNTGIWIGSGLLAASLWVVHRGMNAMLAEEGRRSVSPFTEKLLRPPGESLRLKIDEIRESMMDTGIALTLGMVIPAFAALPSWSASPAVNVVIWMAFAAGGYGLAIFQWPKLKRLRKELRDYRLGFDGERYVAAELDLLISRGYRVFHDFIVNWKPGGNATDFNIDHVAVGPEGVFVFETKARRKPLDSGNGGKQYKVSFDGKTLHFPTYSTAEPLEQATRNAKLLLDWLSKTAKPGLFVTPVVVIPGWWVDAGDNRLWSSVQPIKDLADRVPKLAKGRRLSEEEVMLIARRIEEHCRNVEGA